MLGYSSSSVGNIDSEGKKRARSIGKPWGMQQHCRTSWGAPRPRYGSSAVFNKMEPNNATYRLHGYPARGIYRFSASAAPCAVPFVDSTNPAILLLTPRTPNSAETTLSNALKGWCLMFLNSPVRGSTPHPKHELETLFSGNPTTVFMR